MVRRLVSISALSIVTGIALAAGLNRESSTSAFRHNPTYLPASFFQSALAKHERVNAQPDIRGVIVNHHLLAADYIADTLRRVDWSSIDRVILISPNHFLAGRGFTISGTRDWQTPFGPIKTDQRLVRRLVEQNIVNEFDYVLGSEHGIFNILPFIAALNQRVTMVPLVIRDGMPERTLEALRLALQPYVADRTLVIGSFDFSHSTTKTQAETQDAASIEVLRSVDINDINKVTVDSLPGVGLVLRLMSAAGAKSFTLVQAGNSAQITGNDSQPDVTSYITGYFTSR